MSRDFNKSHAACYALIAYRTAWLRVNYPDEYMAALEDARELAGLTHEHPHAPTQAELDDLFRPDDPQGGLGK